MYLSNLPTELILLITELLDDEFSINTLFTNMQTVLLPA